VRVHDPGRELCEIGAGIYLWVNALRALEAVDPYDEVVAGGERTNSPKLRDHRHGLLQREWLQGGRLITIPRRTLHGALVNAARRVGVDIQTNSAVTGVRADGTLEFVDGTTATRDLVIGADGVHSRVREAPRSDSETRQSARRLRTPPDKPVSAATR
jgi:2-polyprenyl-6-methoxyphenol hydroxylase-like FAD-dependent oxidoreductase